MATIILLLIAVVIIGFNAKASALILNDQLLELNQRIFQLLLVWLFPVIGASLMLGVRQPLKKTSGKYPEDKDDIDGPFGSVAKEETYSATDFDGNN
jgi:hypothetical protein